MLWRNPTHLSLRHKNNHHLHKYALEPRWCTYRFEQITKLSNVKRPLSSSFSWKELKNFPVKHKLDSEWVILFLPICIIYSPHVNSMTYVTKYFQISSLTSFLLLIKSHYRIISTNSNSNLTYLMIKITIQNTPIM